MNQEDIILREKSKTRKFFIYAMPKFGTSVLMGFADFALFTLYALAYQVSPFLVGIALALGKFTIAASQFFWGWISDAKYTRWGRRKPYSIILSPILALSFILLLMPGLVIDLNDLNALFVWLLIIYQIFNISYGCTAPYASWMAEQFMVKERPRASQYENTIGFIGTGTMLVFSMVVLTGFITKIQENPEIIPPDYSISVIIFALILVLLFYLACFLMPTEPHFKIESTMFQNLKVLLKNKNFINVTVMIGIASLGMTQVGSLILQFLVVVLHFDPITNSIASVILVIGILIFLYMWRKLVLKIGKKPSILYIFLSLILFLPFTLLGMIPMESFFIYGMLFTLGIAACTGGWFLIPPVVIADITEDDEKTTGELKAGMYSGFPSIFLNIFQALGLFIMGIILELPDITVGTSTFSLGYVVWGPIVSLILIVAYVYTRKFIQLDFEWEKSQ
jgi:GPH family glycoside/pentoside/hexuronide:cation symporter